MFPAAFVWLNGTAKLGSRERLFKDMLSIELIGLAASRRPDVAPGRTASGRTHSTVADQGRRKSRRGRARRPKAAYRRDCGGGQNLERVPI